MSRALTGIAAQRDVILGLFRRGRIDADALDRQLDQIAEEEAGIKGELREVQKRVAEASEGVDRLRNAEDLLQGLHSRQDESPTWELKRQLEELLVVGIRVDTIVEGGKEVAAAEVTYAFTPADSRTGTGADSIQGGEILRFYSLGSRRLQHGASTPGARAANAGSLRNLGAGTEGSGLTFRLDQS
jgi:hypothetical protein